MSKHDKTINFQPVCCFWSSSSSGQNFFLHRRLFCQGYDGAGELFVCANAGEIFRRPRLDAMTIVNWSCRNFILIDSLWKAVSMRAFGDSAIVRGWYSQHHLYLFLAHGGERYGLLWSWTMHAPSFVTTNDALSATSPTLYYTQAGYIDDDELHDSTANFISPRPVLTVNNQRTGTTALMVWKLTDPFTTAWHHPGWAW